MKKPENKIPMNKNEIESIVMKYMPEKDSFPPLSEAMCYSVQNGGKRLRPLMMLETCRLFSEDTSQAEPFAAAVEMIHSGSLVHDDLPCMDNDELRRGVLSTWKAFGEPTALMAGDALMAYAFETAARSLLMPHPERAARAMSVLADSAGTGGVCLGQTQDMQFTGKEPDGETLEQIYIKKTCALLQASMAIGALIGGADDEAVKIVDEAALHIGLAFQIRDDILDVTADEKSLGKPVGSDSKNNKTTFVTIYGLSGAQKAVFEHSALARALMLRLPGDKAFFLDLIEKLENRNN